MEGRQAGDPSASAAMAPYATPCMVICGSVAFRTLAITTGSVADSMSMLMVM